MRLFIFALLQVLVFFPLASFAADSGKTPVLQKAQKTGIIGAEKAAVATAYGKLPLYFIENKGQVDERVKFYEKGAGHATFFTEDGVVLALTKSDDMDNTKSSRQNKAFKEIKDKQLTTEAVKLTFVGAHKKANLTSSSPLPGHVNYFVGNDKTKWRSNVPTYRAVTYENVYKNIDIKFYGNNKNIEHDIIVRPGGDASIVRFAYEGIQGLKITEDGDLEVSLKEGKIIEKRPLIYQVINGNRVTIEGSYRILKGEEGAFAYGYNMASYDKTKELVIDPVLVYSTYLGGSGRDSGFGIAVDSAGAAYVTGETVSADFPIASPLQGSYGGGPFYGDAFITKINPAGTAIVYSTYLGGRDDDSGRDITVDSTGAVYVTGFTRSTDFPLVAPIQGTYGGGLEDAFITKINPAGTAIAWSTYLGGSLFDWSTGIAVDSSGSAYVTGYTASTDFPLVTPIQGAFGGANTDAFITQINAAGTAFTYSTYLGGTNNDYAKGIAIDSLGAAYVTGYTYSTDFPLVNPLHGTFAGGLVDAFITKLNPSGTVIIWSTYLGGSGDDLGFGIALDNSGFAYVTGETLSVDFPLLSPIQGTFGEVYDAFVTKITPTGTSLIYSTYIGGIFRDVGNGIALTLQGLLM